jgi:hypothetical protein
MLSTTIKGLGLGLGLGLGKKIPNNEIQKNHKILKDFLCKIFFSVKNSKNSKNFQTEKSLRISYTKILKDFLYKKNSSKF